MNPTPYDLFLDDLRDPSYVRNEPGYGEVPIEVARTVDEARRLYRERGRPRHVYFDHDLGVVNGRIEESVEWIDWLASLDDENGEPLLPGARPPTYSIHSDNPPGRRAIESRMGSWTRAYEALNPQE